VRGGGFQVLLDYDDRGRGAESEITRGGLCVAEIVGEVGESWWESRREEDFAQLAGDGWTSSKEEEEIV
jgi:hypothetical protein